MPCFVTAASVSDTKIRVFVQHKPEQLSSQKLSQHQRHITFIPMFAKLSKICNLPNIAINYFE
jgi:hypothetical protein